MKRIFLPKKPNTKKYVHYIALEVSTETNSFTRGEQTKILEQTKKLFRTNNNFTKQTEKKQNKKEQTSKPQCKNNAKMLNYVYYQE